MILPEQLQEAIAEAVAPLKPKELAQFSRELSARYRQAQFALSRGHKLAYLTARMPATFAAIAHVFTKIKMAWPLARPASLLDLGAGPGSGLWAFQAIFGALESATLFERDREFIELGKRLAVGSPCAAQWIARDFAGAALQPSDIVLFSYSIGEIAEEKWAPILEAAWGAASQMAVFIEPGTPQGFARIRKIREIFVGWGGHIIAPCPHSATCPMAGDDWCHFAQRVARSSLHRVVKAATLNYEDEKFAYVAIAKQPLMRHAQARILRHPQKRSGHVALTLCTEQGLKHKIITRRDKEIYRTARSVEWGDHLNER